jgi:hypothetical protein
MCEEKKEINGIINNFYMNLYQAEDDIDLRGVLDHVPVKVTEQMREWLGMSFSADEV